MGEHLDLTLLLMKIGFSSLSVAGKIPRVRLARKRR
jgi:hypothetical protein